MMNSNEKIEGELPVIEGAMQGPELPAAQAVKAKGKAKGAAPKKGLAARNEKFAAAKAKAEAEAKAPKAEVGEGAQAKRKAEGNWQGKADLSDRRWLGAWANLESAAKAGRLPDAMGAKASREDIFGGIFSANTHIPFTKRIFALADLIRAKDENALKALVIKEISTTPIMLGKLRDLAICALAAKAKAAKAKAKHNGNGVHAQEGEGAQA